VRASLEVSPTVIGLRERKKAKTRAAIQRHALRLFRTRGYDETTVDDIAAAAEVSSSTFFRYFPAKEDVVLYDDLDPVLWEAIRRQPGELAPIAAIRRALRETWSKLSDSEIEQMRERERLMRSVPELQMRMVQEMVRTVGDLAAAIARRERRRADDFGARTVAGAVLGALLSAWIAPGEPHVTEVYERMDKALAQLEKGLSLRT